MSSPIDQMLEVYSAPVLEQWYKASIVLIVGEIQTDPFDATWSDHEYAVSDEEGFRTNYQSRDFVFAITNPVFLDQTLKPRTGCRIMYTENGVVKQFEIVPVGDRKAVEDMPGGYRWLVHTVQVA